MSNVNSKWLEQQRGRWIRPNGHLYVRPDAYRFAAPGTPEAKPPGWLDPSATRVRVKEAQEEEARQQATAAQEEFEREMVALRHDLAKLKLEYELWCFDQKYSPDQPRVPAGSPDGGQWTSGGGDAASSSSNAPAVGQRLRVAQVAAPTRSDANTAPFSPDRSGWHNYRRGPTLACSAELRCSREEMVDQLARYSLPGRDPSMPVKNEGTYPVHIPGTDIYVGDVTTTITENGLAIENRTRQGHIFFDGMVVRRLTQSDDGAWYVTTHGFGNNVQPGSNVVNQLVGPEVFEELDRQMRANIERHHAKGAVLDLPVHRMVGGGRHGAGPAVVGAGHEIP